MKLVSTTVLTCLISMTCLGADLFKLTADPWCPITCEGVEKPGLVVEFAKIAMKAAKKELEYNSMPWARALQMTRAGKIDGVAGVTPADSEGLFLAKTPFSMENCLFVREQDQWTYSGISSLKGRVLGAINTYTYEEPAIDAYISEHQKDTSKVQLSNGDKALAQNIKKLQAGRIQVMIEEKSVVEFLEPSKRKGIKVLTCVTKSPLYIGVSKKIPKAQEIVKAFESKTAELLQDERWLSATRALYGLGKGK